MREEVVWWIEDTRNTLESARDMFRAGRFNWAVFLCHQAMEKILKASYLQLKKRRAPGSHNLYSLYRGLQDRFKVSREMASFLRRLSPQYAVTRYPDVALGPPHEAFDKESAREFLNKTEEIFRWLRAKLR